MGRQALIANWRGCQLHLPRYARPAPDSASPPRPTPKRAGGVEDREAVLNGIAFDRETNRLFVTGKNWPKLFEIRLTAR